MTAAKKGGQNAQVEQAIPGLEGLPEIPQLGALDDGGAGADAGGQGAGPGAAEETQQQTQSQPPVAAAKPKATPRAKAEPKSKLELVLDAHPHDLVGGRHLAVIDGEHVWLTNTAEGGHVLTYHGEQLAAKLLGE